MGGRAVCLLVGLLMVCGFCPPSGVSNRIPRGFDAANVLLRVALAAGYLWTQLLTPSTIQELTTKTYEVLTYFSLFLSLKYVNNNCLTVINLSKDNI